MPITLIARRLGPILLLLVLALPACEDLEDILEGDGDTYRVLRVIDGDTIEVSVNGRAQDVRYVGVNTPERGDVCYTEATRANAALVEGERVRLERDESNTDRYDRWLRYVYVGEVFVNAELVREGWAEAVLYEPDDEFYSRFVELEQEAATAGRGCHPLGIFNDGTYRR